MADLSRTRPSPEQTSSRQSQLTPNTARVSSSLTARKQDPRPRARPSRSTVLNQIKSESTISRTRRHTTSHNISRQPETTNPEGPHESRNSSLTIRPEPRPALPKQYTHIIRYNALRNRSSSSVPGVRPPNSSTDYDRTGSKRKLDRPRACVRRMRSNSSS